MKRLAAGVALLLLAGAATVSADRWIPRKRLPKPIDFPIVREKVREHHKPGNKQKHPPDPVAFIVASALTARA
jgi:hypothetical protein